MTLSKSFFASWPAAIQNFSIYVFITSLTNSQPQSLLTQSTGKVLLSSIVCICRDIKCWYYHWSPPLFSPFWGSLFSSCARRLGFSNQLSGRQNMFFLLSSKQGLNVYSAIPKSSLAVALALPGALSAPTPSFHFSHNSESQGFSHHHSRSPPHPLLVEWYLFWLFYKYQKIEWNLTKISLWLWVYVLGG